MAYSNNQPNTRERIAARRRSRAANAPKQARQAQRVVKPVRPVAPRSKRRTARTETVPGAGQVARSWVASGRIASAVLLLGALAGFIYIFTNTRFTIQTVEVSGTEVLNSSEIIKLADAEGQSIWYADTAAIAEKVKASPYVANASASVALPGTLLLNIVERRPELRWSNGGQQFFIDQTGRVLGVAEASATLTNTLVIEDRSARALKPNDYVDRDALSVANTLALRLTPETGVKPLSINWATDKGVYVLAPDNKTIIFGKSERIGEKLTVLDSLLKQGAIFTLLDLRPKTPFYRNDVAPVAGG